MLRFKLQQVECVRNRAVAAVGRGPIDVIAETDERPRRRILDESSRSGERAPPVAVRIPEHGRLGPRHLRERDERWANGNLCLQAVQELVRAFRREIQDAAGVDEVSAGHHPTDGRRSRTNEGMRGAGIPGGRRRTDPPFEPANALGNRVLSPASVAPAMGAGLAELEHPRISIVTREYPGE